MWSKARGERDVKLVEIHIFVFVRFTMSPKAMKKSVSGTFWELMLRHPAGCIVFLVIPLVAVVLVLVVAFLGMNFTFDFES